jgi:hypothetical protein
MLLMRGVKLERETVLAAVVPVVRIATPTAMARSEACIVNLSCPALAQGICVTSQLFRVVSEWWYEESLDVNV